MPWCPKCRYEYEPEVTICPDCGEELRDEPVAPSTPASRRPPSAIVRVLAALGVSFPLLLVFLVLAYLLIDWLMMNWLCTMSWEEEFVHTAMFAAALSGFVTGALLHKLVKPIHVFAAGLVVGAAYAAYLIGSYWQPSRLEVLGQYVVLLPLAAAFTSARGIAFGRGQRLKSLLWLFGFLAILAGAMLAMYPLFNLVSK